MNKYTQRSNVNKEIITEPKEIRLFILERNITPFGQTEETLCILSFMKSLIGSDACTPGSNSILRADINLSQLNITLLQNKYFTALNLLRISNHYECETRTQIMGRKTSFSPSNRQLGYYISLLKVDG